MKEGRSLMDLAREVERQRGARRDFLAPTTAVEMTPAARLRLGGEEFGVGPVAHDQIAAHAGIPAAYYRRMAGEAPALLAANVNEWFRREPAKRLVRTIDGAARAFLSNSYRPLDNDALLEAALPPLMEMGVEVMSCEVTERRLYLKVVDRRIARDVPTGRRLGDGSHVFFDTASPALVLSNSEVGLGALSVQTSVYTHLCTNLAVIGERSARRYHIGARREVGDEVYAMFTDETRRLSDAAIWAQTADVVRGAFDRARFDATCDALAAAAQDRLDGADPAKVVEVTAGRFGLTAAEGSSVLRHLIEGGDLTRYGLHAAVTRAAGDAEEYDRASELERVGGAIVELPRAEWAEIARAA